MLESTDRSTAYFNWRSPEGVLPARRNSIHKSFIRRKIYLDGQSGELLSKVDGLAKDLRNVLRQYFYSERGKVAELTGLSYTTVCRWGQRFEINGIVGLDDEPRAGQPNKLSSAIANVILRLTVERIPYVSTHWSLRLVANRRAISTVAADSAARPRHHATNSDLKRTGLLLSRDECIRSRL